jgi:hypothetical protein
MSFSSSALDRYEYRLGPMREVIAVGLATELCRRVRFVTPSQSGS